MLMVAGTVSAYVGQATLGWDSPDEPGMSDHRLYYGQSSGDYTSSIDVGNQTGYTVTGLEAGKTYNFCLLRPSESPTKAGFRTRSAR